mgnify:CR=1 FL=1
MGTTPSVEQQQVPRTTISSAALQTPAFVRLQGKRVVLASGSPRRAELLASVGVHPEVVPSTFAEDLDKTEFADERIYEYPVATASHKAVEVYERLVRATPADPPDLVIGADTVLVHDGQVLEKPHDAADNFRVLADLCGKSVAVITGVALVHPILAAPGFKVRTVAERTEVHFADTPHDVLRAYVASGEGADRAGGFAIQGRGALLVRGIEGDFANVVGFPLYSVFALLHELVVNEELDLEGTD